jgi:hypothetical protein
MGLLAKLIPNRLLMRVARVQEQAANDAERALMLSVPDLQELGYNIDYEPALETVVSRAFPDGTCEIKYTYDPDAADVEGRHVLVITRAERLRTVDEAVETYHAGLKAFAFGARLDRASLQGSNGAADWAANLFVGHMFDKSGERRTATVLSAQRHRLVYSVITRGIIAESDDDVDELIYEPALRAVEWASRP